MRNGRTIVNQADLEESIEVVIAGYQKKNAVLSDREKKIVAYHEIGHALVAALQHHSAPVQKITIIPRTSGALGYTMQVDTDDKNLLTHEEIEDKIATYTGGRAAEEIVFGTYTTGASNDIQRATGIARDMVSRYGMSDRLGPVSYASDDEVFIGRNYEKTKSYSERIAGDIDDEVHTILQRAYEHCDRLLREHDDQLCRVAEFLLAHDNMTRPQFEAAMESRTIPQPEAKQPPDTAEAES